jgi:hypothetical protein
MPESWTILFCEKPCWAAKRKSTNEKSTTILTGTFKFIELVFKDRDSFKFRLITRVHAGPRKKHKPACFGRQACLHETLR